MSRHASPSLIGLFVVGAIAIILTSLVLLGGRSVFQDKTTCVSYFEEGIAGLDIGARVELGGVRVGTVTDIRIVFDEGQKEVRRPVTFQLEHSRFTLQGSAESEKSAALLDAIENHGLRTQVATDNLLTGKLKVTLVFAPNSPNNLLKADDAKDAVEVPSTPSPFSSLVRTAEDLPLREIVIDAHRAVKDGQQALLAAADAASNLNALVVNMDRNLAPLLTNLTRVAENAEKMTSPDSVLNGETRAALEEIRGAARAVKEFSDYASRHPESLMKGKP